MYYVHSVSILLQGIAHKSISLEIEEEIRSSISHYSFDRVLLFRSAC